MNNKFKAVMIGSAHVHVLEVARYCYENSSINLVACADTKSKTKNLERNAIYTRNWNLKYVAENFGLKVYENYIDMLDDIKPGLALITSENSLHREIVENCAKRGIAVSVEKPMAITLSEGIQMVEVTQKYKSLLMVNWPIAWRPYYYKIKELVDEGRIGELSRIRHFAGNTGAVGIGAKHRGVSEYAEVMSEEERAKLWWFQSSWGGGAMLDFCSYGCLASCWLTKQSALSAFGMKFSSSEIVGDVEDNAGMMVSFANCYATLEGTWMSPGIAVPPGPQIYGTKGVILCEREGDKVILKVLDMYGKTEIIKDMGFEKKPKNIAECYVRHIDGEDLPEMVGMDVNLRGLACLDAGIRSAKSGKVEPVKSINLDS